MIRKSLQFQSLENRELLAADAYQSLPLPTAIGEPIESLDHVDVRPLDAGSSQSSAFPLGPLEGSRRLRGQLDRYDRIDMVRFSIASSADVTLGLNSLSQDADLYLIDSRGQLLSLSNRRGKLAESITAQLDAGEYYVAVIARSSLFTEYRLVVSAQLENSVDAPPPAAPISAPATPAPTPPLADVPYFGGSRQWNLNQVGAPEAWAAGYTGDDVTIAVIDTGVDLDHPDLVHSLYVNPGEIANKGIDDDGNGFVDDVHGYDFASRDGRPDDGHGHGTHVAGTIAAANNGRGSTGVAPGAKIMPVRVLGDNGAGNDFNVAAGIRYAAQMGADIINLSLGGGFSSRIQTAVREVRSWGVLVVAAAGNESASAPGFPARFSADFDHVISVGAFDAAGTIAAFSNKVGTSAAVQIDAPGVGVFSTYHGGRYATMSGTSMASPHVAGLAALVLSANPKLTASQLRDLLATGTIDSADGSDAIGIASALRSVAFAAAGQWDAHAATATVSSPSAASLSTTSQNQNFGQSLPIGSATFNDRRFDLSDPGFAYCRITTNEDRQLVKETTADASFGQAIQSYEPNRESRANDGQWKIQAVDTAIKQLTVSIEQSRSTEWT